MKFTANRSRRRRVFDLSIAIWFKGGTQNFQQGQQIHYRDPYVQEWNLTSSAISGSYGASSVLRWKSRHRFVGCRGLKPGSGEYSRISKSQPHSALSLLGKLQTVVNGPRQLPGRDHRGSKKISRGLQFRAATHCENLSNEAGGDRPRRSPARAVALWTTRTILASTTATSHTHAGIDS